MQSTATDNSIVQMGMREFNLFRSLVQERTGIWLRDGKQIMLAARLSRRLRHHGLSNFADYYEYIRTVPPNSPEIRELINCVTTNKTSFFRERHHFDYLGRTLVPEMAARAAVGGSRNIRIWSACCSTGEEPYSIAITLLEALETAQNARTAARTPSPGMRPAPSSSVPITASWRIEVVATDIDTAVLQKASRAVYPLDSMQDIDLTLQKKYFLRGKDDMQGSVKIKSDVARLVQFKHVNLMENQWPLEGGFDVIFFRNALIYFQQETQDIFLRKMARLLKPKGHLFLGNSEHIPWLNDIYEPLRQTMYRLREVNP